MFRKTLAAILAMSSLLLVAPAMAETGAAVDLQCMNKAVGARDSALLGVFGNFSTAHKASILVRLDNLQKAWLNPDVKIRRAAINAAWKTFRAAHRVAFREYNAAGRSAWTAFRTTAKACHATGADVDATMGSDNSIGN